MAVGSAGSAGRARVGAFSAGSSGALRRCGSGALAASGIRGARAGGAGSLLDFRSLSIQPAESRASPGAGSNSEGRRFCNTGARSKARSISPHRKSLGIDQPSTISR
jgi:hypothetical protein